MQRYRYALELFFGIGFRIGFLVACVGIFMMFLPILIVKANPILEYVGFYGAIRNNPEWFKALVIGLLMMGIAVVLSLLKNWVEPAWDILLGKDEFSEPKQL